MRYKSGVKARSRYSLNLTKFLSDDEWNYLEAICRRQLGGDDKRDALMVLLALRTGARAAELLDVRVKDVFHRESRVLIRGVKGSNDREIALPIYLTRAIGDYVRVERLRDDDRLFPISYHTLRKIWLHYRPARKVFHSLRHTFGLNVYLKTRDLRLVQYTLGHRSIQNTLIYVDYAYSMREMREIIF